MFISGQVRHALLVGLIFPAFNATLTVAQAATPLPPSKPSYAQLLATAKPDDWRSLDLDSTLYMDLPTGRVVIELSAAYAPAHVANIRALVREGYFDGLAILRSQDNYGVQWGDPEAENIAPGTARAAIRATETDRTEPRVRAK